MIISRQQWGARAPQRRRTVWTPTPELWLHHTADEVNFGEQGMRNIQRFHMDSRGWSDIAYNFVVDDQTGLIYEGRGFGIAGGHTENHNSISHGICVMGNFEQRKPKEHTLRAVANLVRYGNVLGYWTDELTGGHRDTKSTSCPGRYLYERISTINHLANRRVWPMFYADGRDVIIAAAAVLGAKNESVTSDIQVAQEAIGANVKVVAVGGPAIKNLGWDSWAGVGGTSRDPSNTKRIAVWGRDGKETYRLLSKLL